MAAARAHNKSSVIAYWIILGSLAALALGLGAAGCISSVNEINAKTEQISVLTAQVESLQDEVQSANAEATTAQLEAEQCRLSGVHLRGSAVAMAQEVITFLDKFPSYQMDLSVANSELDASNTLPCDNYLE